MRDFKELQVWQKAHEFVIAIYSATRSFPTDERFGITSQMRRAAVSIGSNIAEGCGRGGERELARYLTIAAGSACEIEYQLILVRDLGFLSEGMWISLEGDVQQIKKMLGAFIRTIGAKG